jgi:type III pantothenate kinase
LSLTRVDGGGRFAGGRLSAGLGLQLWALAGGTAQLPALAPPSEAAPAPPLWPAATAEAMARGCRQACAAAIAQGWADLEGPGPWALWLTGGDGAALAPELQRLGLPARWAPDLCLEALAALVGLRPEPGR